MVGAWRTVLIGVVLASALQASTARAADGARAVLAALKAATGGSGWDSGGALVTEGRKTSFGLTGPYEAVEDLTSGRFVRRADYGLFRNAEGLDAQGRWRVDNSGATHPLDTEEAREVAATEAFLARRGYLHPERGDATYRLAGRVRAGGATYERVEATPAGGRAVTLWIDRATRYLDRAVIERSNRTQTLRFSDNRAVAGLVLPFGLAVENGDQSETGEIAVARYRLDRAPEPPPARPGPPTDASLRVGEGPAWLRLDPMSGFLLVEARIDAAPPMLFILDTGGHDVLTPSTADALGLTRVGHGFGLGAGAGSIPTAYAKVARLRVGAAEVVDQPFVVLALNLGQGIGRDGAMKPIAGIIGLELFERFAATLDYGRGELRLCPFAAAAGADGGAALRFSDDMPLAQGALNGVSAWFDLDTGNNGDAILFKAWVMAHGRAAGLAPAGGPVTGSGVGGDVSFRRSRAPRLSLAGAEITGLDVLLAGDGMGSLSGRFEAGNIGESVLSRFTVSFDYARERFWLSAPGSSGICRPSPAGDMKLSAGDG
ncbi:pepsin/retropepsin-like aspartic protease family protein [Phenylobacterium sp.]|uniref:pepsin/retropepsin-like aspartic protease family protein n=1 Tax=Phenylobacterium sp. TaxID=1871053 RepID=UPI002DEE7ED8|nr:pepsin/retropepsin-like aspartic protease family protein [Phenylobacterium sp.]